MFGIVVMANCTWVMQVALGASYLLLNGLYLLAALSRHVIRKMHWDFSGLTLTHVSEKSTHTFTHAL
jgi:hypothetical protein